MPEWQTRLHFNCLSMFEIAFLTKLHNQSVVGANIRTIKTNSISQFWKKRNCETTADPTSLMVTKTIAIPTVVVMGSDDQKPCYAASCFAAFIEDGCLAQLCAGIPFYLRSFTPKVQGVTCSLQSIYTVTQGFASHLVTYCPWKWPHTIREHLITLIIGNYYCFWKSTNVDRLHWHCNHCGSFQAVFLV